MYERVKPVRDEVARLRWLHKQISMYGYRCQACYGRPDWRGAAIHHIIRFRRSDEETNFMLLCGCCHDLCHDGSGPKLNLGVVCMVKFIENPDEFSLSRLEQLRGQPIELEPLPEWLQEKRRVT